MVHSNAIATARENLLVKIRALPPVEQEYWLNEFLETVDESAVCWTAANARNSEVQANAADLWKKLDDKIGDSVSAKKLAAFIRELDEEAEFEAEIEAPGRAGMQTSRVIDYEHAELLFKTLEAIERQESGTNGSNS